MLKLEYDLQGTFFESINPFILQDEQVTSGLLQKCSRLNFDSQSASQQKCKSAVETLKRKLPGRIWKQRGSNRVDPEGKRSLLPDDGDVEARILKSGRRKKPSRSEITKEELMRRPRRRMLENERVRERNEKRS